VLKEIKVSLFVLLSSLLLCGSAFGGAFRATKRTDSDCYKIGPELQVVGSNMQIWTAVEILPFPTGIMFLLLSD
jgi:hypothetical protein